MSAYGTSAVKRSRRTRAELETLHEAILQVCRVDHPITVRGVFYRVMSTGIIAKTEKSYRVIQREVLKLRRVGELPYAWIEDGSRWHIKEPSWSGPEQALSDMWTSYRRALWHDQRYYVEIWSEKDAISGIVSPVTDSYDVPLAVGRGFGSETFLWKTAATITTIAKPTVIYQLGDHDPSGLAAWEHIQRKLRQFIPKQIELDFERIAVTPEQIYSMNLPTRPTKKSDSRARNFAGDSVEVDAIPSTLLKGIVTNAIEVLIDPEALRATKLAEEHERDGLERMAAGWSA